jgi:hypothetical protein
MSSAGDDPNDQTDGSYYDPFPAGRPPGLIGGQFADMMANAPPAGMTGLDAAALGVNPDFSSDGAGLPPLVVMESYLPQLNTERGPVSGSLGQASAPEVRGNGGFICRKSDGNYYYSNGSGLGVGTGQALATADAPTINKFRTGLGGGGPSGNTTSPLSLNLRDAFGYSIFRPLEHATGTASVGGSLARGLGSLGILGSLLDFFAMTTDPDVCVPDEF